MNKHAYLIIAHHQFELLEMLCKMIDHPNHDIFIHIDKKAKGFDNNKFENITQYSKVFFTKRTDVIWGDYSQINSELVLLKAAQEKGRYGYYHLLSGVDMLLKPAHKIYNFFEENYGKEFITCGEAPVENKNFIRKRIEHYFLFQKRAGRDNDRWKRCADKLNHYQYVLGVDRLKGFDKQLLCGGNWFSITDKLAKYVVDNEGWIKKHFRYTQCADEVFLQTLISGTEFEENLYMPVPQPGYIACMHLVDWQRGDPYTYKKEDFKELINSPFMFARKFDIAKYPEICHMLYDYVMNNQ